MAAPKLEKQYLALSQAAIRYSTPVDTLRRWARDGKIPAYRIGRKYLIDVEAMDQYVENGKNTVGGLNDQD